jgi:hypothetical protein
MKKLGEVWVRYIPGNHAQEWLGIPAGGGSTVYDRWFAITDGPFLPVSHLPNLWSARAVIPADHDTPEPPHPGEETG